MPQAHWLKICMVTRSPGNLLLLLKSAQSCVCDSMDCSPPGSSVHGLLQAGILERVIISFSRGSSQPRDGTWVSCICCYVRRIPYYERHLGSPCLLLRCSHRVTKYLDLLQTVLGCGEIVPISAETRSSQAKRSSGHPRATMLNGPS